MWKFNPFLLPVLNNKLVICAALKEFFILNKGSSEISIVWEAMKVYLWGTFIKHISVIKFRSKALTSA